MPLLRDKSRVPLTELTNLAIAGGFMTEEGMSSISKFGRNADIDTAAAEDVWNQGGTYTFLAAATTLYVSSSDNADTHEITVVGLDANWAEQTQTVDLTGQTQAAIPGTWIRVFRAYNSDSTTTTGDVYIAETDDLTSGVPDTTSKIKAKIDAAAQQTLMAIYSVPAGKTAYLTNLFVDMNKATAAASAIDVTLSVREFGGVFRTQFISGAFLTGSSHFPHDYQTPLVIPEKSDIKLVVAASANNTDVSGGFDITLKTT